MPSFKDGGAYWFVDLTTPDALYILPVLTALTFLITVEVTIIFSEPFISVHFVHWQSEFLTWMFVQPQFYVMNLSCQRTKKNELLIIPESLVSLKRNEWCYLLVFYPIYIHWFHIISSAICKKAWKEIQLLAPWKKSQGFLLSLQFLSPWDFRR